MVSYFRSNSIIWLTLSVLVLILMACTPSYEVTWEEVQDQTGTTPDVKGGVLIVGGSVKGPSGSGGQAEWTITTEASQVDRLSFVITTNGEKWYGKGIHSTKQNGTVDIYVNNMLVHTIVCDTRGAYGDYWPQKALVGSSAYDTGTIDVSGRGINGPILTIKIVASPYTALDINRIKISVASEGA